MSEARGFGCVVSSVGLPSCEQHRLSAGLHAACAHPVCLPADPATPWSVRLSTDMHAACAHPQAWAAVKDSWNVQEVLEDSHTLPVALADSEADLVVRQYGSW
jgi:hypothetical protein